MSTFIWGYNNMITFKIEADTENESYIKLVDIIENIQGEYPVQLPDINCFDIITCY